MMTMRRAVLLSSVIILLLLCSFVNGFEAGSIRTEELRERVQSRWQAIAEHKFGSAYEYETPNFKKVFSQKLFLNKFARGSDSEFKNIDSVVYDAETNIATVVLNLASKSTGTPSKTWNGQDQIHVKVKEKWLFLEEQWWHVSK